MISLDISWLTISFRVGFGVTFGAGVGYIAYCTLLELLTWLGN